MQKVLFSSSSLPIHWPSFHLLGGEVAALALAAAAAAALLWFLTVSKLLAACVVSVAVSFSSAVAVALPPNALDTPMANCASSRAWTAAMSACSAFPRAVAVLQIQQIQAIINKENDDHYNLTQCFLRLKFIGNSLSFLYTTFWVLFQVFNQTSIKEIHYGQIRDEIPRRQQWRQSETWFDRGALRRTRRVEWRKTSNNRAKLGLPGDGNVGFLKGNLGGSLCSVQRWIDTFTKLCRSH